LILAGGKGTRLLPLTKYHPKVMTSIHGKPLLHYLLKLYEKEDIILSLCYMSKSVKGWLRQNKHWPEIVNEEVPQGHGGAILYAQPFLDNCKMFAVVNGDTIHDINLNLVKRNFLKSKDIAIKVNATNAVNNKIEGSGVYLFKKDIFRFLRKNIHTDDILKCVPTQELELKDNYYIDIGSHTNLRFAKNSKFFQE